MPVAGPWQQVNEFDGKEPKPTFLMGLTRKGIEVLHMVDPVDECIAQREKEFDSKNSRRPSLRTWSTWASRPCTWWIPPTSCPRSR